jgi:hypothetical protein
VGQILLIGRRPFAERRFAPANIAHQMALSVIRIFPVKGD